MWLRRAWEWGAGGVRRRASEFGAAPLGLWGERRGPGLGASPEGLGGVKEIPEGLGLRGGGPGFEGTPESQGGMGGEERPQFWGLSGRTGREKRVRGAEEEL